MPSLVMKDSELQSFHLGLSLALSVQIHLWEFSRAAEPRCLLRAQLETDPKMALNSNAQYWFDMVVIFRF